MEATPEGLAAAAKTRAALEESRKKRKEQTDAVAVAASGSKKKKAKQSLQDLKACHHEVQRPEGFQDDEVKLDESIYGARHAT